MRETKNGYLQYLALSSRVLVVVSVNTKVGDWSAYIDAVPGMNHECEFQEVARFGSKLQEDVAKLLFPYEAGKYKWRD